MKQGTSTKATYRYNAFGQRVSKVAGSTTTYYVYDDTGLLLGEYNGSGVAVQEFVWLDGLPAMILTPSANYYVHPDHLGTPRLVYNSAGKIIWRWNSDPFGATAANEDPDGDKVKFTFNLRFPGQVFDKESGLHYNYFRDYDPSIGRYVQADPIGLNGGWNVYGYVGGNPLSRIDPDGKFFFIPGLIGALGEGGAALLGGGATLAGTGILMSKPKPGAKPKGCPPGTIPIDQAKGPRGWDKDDVHGIKGGVGAGPRDWVGISPGGRVITGDHKGDAVDNGPADEYLP